MFTDESRLITRHCELSFLVDLREEDEDPIRANRGAKAKRLPDAVTVEEGPFAFTLVWSSETAARGKEVLKVGLEVTRKNISGDPSFDSEQTILPMHILPHGRLDEEGYRWPYAAPIVLPVVKGSKRISSGYLREAVIDLFGEEEPVVANIVVSCKLTCRYEVPRTQMNRRAPTLDPLDTLATIVSTPRPNDVTFILASAPFKPLYSNKSILSAASPYFQYCFDRPGHSRRASGAVNRTPSFVDDSDAESQSGDDDDDMEMLIPPEEIGTRRKKRKSSQEEEAVKEEESSPSKKKKTKSSPRDRNGEEGEDKNLGGPVEIHVDDGARKTLEAILVYLLCGRIEFAPLSIQGRDEYVREYRKKYPERPTPVSPRSVYRLAVRFEIDALQELALTHLKESFTLDSAIQESLSDECFHFPEYCTIVHDLVVKDWIAVQKTPVWKETLKKAHKGEYSYSNTLLTKLLIRGTEEVFKK